MAVLQSILAYLILALAIGFLLKKYVLPKSLFASGKKTTHKCGNDDCGCH